MAVGSPTTSPSGGAITVNADGSATWNGEGDFATLPLGQTATVTYEVDVTDSDTPPQTATFTLTLTVQGTYDNIAPTASIRSVAAVTAPDAVLTVVVDLADNVGVTATPTAASLVVSGSGVPSPRAASSVVTSGVAGDAARVATFTFDAPDLANEFVDLGTLTFTLAAGAAGDAAGNVTAEATAASSVDIEDAPVATDDAGAVVAGQTLTVAAPGVLANDTDLDGDALSVVSVNGVDLNVGAPTVLLSGSTLTLNADGSYTYETAGAFPNLLAPAIQDETFTYEVTDGVSRDTGSVTITITGSQRAPTIVADTLTLDHGATDTSLNVLANDSDADVGDVITVYSVDGLTQNVGVEQTQASGSTFTLAANGALTYTANQPSLLVGQTADETLAYVARDDKGNLSGAGTVTVTINGTGVATDAINDDLGEINHGQTANGDLLTNDLGPSLTIDQVSGAGGNVGAATAGSGGGLFTIQSDGSYVYDPGSIAASLTITQTIVDSITYRATGPNGSDTATVTITVRGTQETPVAPVAVDDAYGPVPGDSVYTVATRGAGVLGDDTDANAGQTATLVVSAATADAGATVFTIGSPATLASGDIVTLNADGTFSLDPRSARPDLLTTESANVVVAYTVEDADGLTDDGTLTITVNGAALAISASDDAFSSDADASAAALGNVLSNDAGRNPQATAFTNVAGSAGGLGSLSAAGAFTFSANGAFNQYATDDAPVATTWTYTVASSTTSSPSDTGTITVNVQGTAPVPSVQSPTLAATEGSVLNVAALGGLLNGATGETMTVTSVGGSPSNVASALSTVSGASLTVQADGSLVYDPTGASAIEQLAAGATLDDVVAFQATDARTSRTVSGSVTFRVTGINDPVDAGSDQSYSATVSSGAVVFNLLAAATDVDTADTLTVTDVDGVTISGADTSVATATGTLVVSPDGSATWTPGGSAAGPDAMIVTVSDGTATDTLTLTLETTAAANVAPTNSGPVLISATQDVAYDVAGVLLSTASDSDAGPSALRVQSVGGVSVPDGGSAVVLTDGAATYTAHSDGRLVIAQGDEYDDLGAGVTEDVALGDIVITDGAATTTVTGSIVTITGVDDQTVAGAQIDLTATEGDGAVSRTGGAGGTGILGGASDPDANATFSVTEVAINGASAVSVPITGQALNSGSIDVAADGSYTWTPNASGAGSDSLVFTVSGGGTLTTTRTLTLDTAAAGGGGVVANGRSFEIISAFESFGADTWINADFTFEAWIYVPSGQSPTTDEQFGAVSGIQGGDGYLFGVKEDGGSGNLRAGVWVENGAWQIMGQGDTNLSEDAWYHVAAVYDESAGTIVIYLNGVQDSSYASDLAPFTPSSGRFRVETLGSQPNFTDRGTVLMSDVRIWTRTRTGVEIAADRFEVYSGLASTVDLAFNWDMHGTSATVDDQVGAAGSFAVSPGSSGFNTVTVRPAS